MAKLDKARVERLDEACNKAAMAATETLTRIIEESFPDSEGENRILSLTKAAFEIAAAVAARVNMPPHVAIKSFLVLYGRASGNDVRVMEASDDDASPNTFAGKPIVGHC